MTEIIEKIISLEWEMFQRVENEGGRASCQDDPTTFYHMRKSQFSAWTEEICLSYLEDLRAAAKSGRNLVEEKYARMMASTRRCAVNPIIGREMEGHEVQPALVKKKVLIAGGGPGGLYAAYTAARRGHEVILCEKTDEVGGILKCEQALPFKQEMYMLGGTYALLAKKAGAEIRLNTEVTPEYVAKEAPDAVIVAVGAEASVPPIPGIKGDNVIQVTEFYLN